VPQNEVVRQTAGHTSVKIIFVGRRFSQASKPRSCRDGGRSSGRVAGNFGDLRDFSPPTRGRASLWSIRKKRWASHFEQPFTTDSCASRKGISCSKRSSRARAVGIYDSIRDLLKHWTPAEGSRRVLIVVSSGHDLKRGAPGHKTRRSTLSAAGRRSRPAIRSGCLYDLRSRPWAFYARGLAESQRTGQLGRTGIRNRRPELLRRFREPRVVRAFHAEHPPLARANSTSLPFSRKTGEKVSIAKLRVTSEQSAFNCTPPSTSTFRPRANGAVGAHIYWGARIFLLALYALYAIV